MTDTSRSLKEGVVGMSVWPKNDSLPAPVCESNEGMFLIYKNLRIERDGNEYNQALRWWAGWGARGPRLESETWQGSKNKQTKEFLGVRSPPTATRDAQVTLALTNLGHENW